MWQVFILRVETHFYAENQEKEGVCGFFLAHQGAYMYVVYFGPCVQCPISSVQSQNTEDLVFGAIAYK